MTFVEKQLTYPATKLAALTLACVGVLSTVVGCGGGGGSSSGSSTATAQTTSSSTARINALPSSDVSSVEPTQTTSLPASAPMVTMQGDNTPELAAFNLLNYNRSQCGFGTLTRQSALDTSAANHANYIKLASNTNLRPMASHYEQTETDASGRTLPETGLANDYYSGVTLSARLNPDTKTLGAKATATTYASAGHGENLSMFTQGNTAGYPNVNTIQAVRDMLSGLFAAPYHMKGLLAPQFTDVGVSYQQAKWVANPYYYIGNILEIVSALPAGSYVPRNQTLLNFPCDGVETDYALTDETPNPFGDQRDLEQRPIGQPIYVLAAFDKTIQTASLNLSENGRSAGFIHVLKADNDPHQRLAANEVIFMPDVPLKPSTVYQANYQLTYVDGSRDNKTFSFKTKAATN